MTAQATNLQFDYTKYGFRNEENYLFKAPAGLSEKVVRELSRMKGEPEWMLKRSLKALESFNQKPVPPTLQHDTGGTDPLRLRRKNQRNPEIRE